MGTETINYDVHAHSIHRSVRLTNSSCSRLDNKYDSASSESLSRCHPTDVFVSIPLLKCPVRDTYVRRDLIGVQIAEYVQGPIRTGNRMLHVDRAIRARPRRPDLRRKQDENRVGCQLCSPSADIACCSSGALSRLDSSCCRPRRGTPSCVPPGIRKVSTLRFSIARRTVDLRQHSSIKGSSFLMLLAMHKCPPLHHRRERQRTLGYLVTPRGGGEPWMKPTLCCNRSTGNGARPSSI